MAKLYHTMLVVVQGVGAFATKLSQLKVDSVVALVIFVPLGCLIMLYSVADSVLALKLLLLEG